MLPFLLRSDGLRTQHISTWLRATVYALSLLAGYSFSTDIMQILHQLPRQQPQKPQTVHVGHIWHTFITSPAYTLGHLCTHWNCFVNDSSSGVKTKARRLESGAVVDAVKVVVLLGSLSTTRIIRYPYNWKSIEIICSPTMHIRLDEPSTIIRPQRSVMLMQKHIVNETRCLLENNKSFGHHICDSLLFRWC